MNDKLDRSRITHEFLKSMDGKIVWIRDDYLSMRGLCYWQDETLHDFLEYVEKVKEEVRQTGYVFSA